MFFPTQNLKVFIALGSTDMRKSIKDYFQWPESKEQVLSIGSQELAWLINGLSIYQEKAHKMLKYSAVF